MKTRPFLSHRRADRTQVIALKRTLALYGVGGWRDLDDLHLGELGQPAFDAINTVTGGFIWYGRRGVLDTRGSKMAHIALRRVIRHRRSRPCGDGPSHGAKAGEVDAFLSVAA